MRLQAAISHEVRLKRTPQLRFAADPAVAAGQRIEDILRGLPHPEAERRRRRPARPVIDGLAVVDKPAGMTSHDVVARCRRLFGQKRVGHAGTLDPDATGVLLVGLGRATRLLQFQSGLPKSYRAEVVLGVATTTLDAAGEVTGRWDQRQVTLEEARRAAAGLTGTIWQVPPMVSAVKVGGRRLHQLARQGVEVERAARQVTVWRFDVESLDGQCGRRRVRSWPSAWTARRAPTSGSWPPIWARPSAAGPTSAGCAGRR